MPYSVQTKIDTWFKTSKAQGGSLADDQKSLVKAGTSFPLMAYKVDGDHLQITLGKDEKGQQVFVAGKNTWFVYGGAADILQDGKVVSLAGTGSPATGGGSGGSSGGGSGAGSIPQAGIDLIKKFEGYAEALPDGRAKAYADPIHGWAVPTIGYGTTVYPDGSKVKQGDIITEAQAEQYLVAHVDSMCRPALEKIPTWGRMNANQRGALYSFAYNLGENFYGGPDTQSITKVCDAVDRWTDKAWIKEQFIKYCNPGSSAEEGLRRRRVAEAALFCS